MGMKPSTQGGTGLIEIFAPSELDIIKSIYIKMGSIEELSRQLTAMGDIDFNSLVHNTILGRDAVDAHPISSITGLTQALADAQTPPYDDTSLSNRVTTVETNKVDKVNGFGLSENNFTLYYKSGLDFVIDNIGNKANVLHTHSASDITDLQSALDNKQDTLVSGTSIKTVNGTSLLGSGNIVIAGGGSSDHSTLTNRNVADAHDISSITGLATALAGKAGVSVVTTSVNGLMANSDKIKLDGVSAGATVNSTDATLLNRSNHTGTQAIASVSGLQTALDSKAGTAVATTTVNGLFEYTDKIKLNSITAGATVNSSDATLLNRANHTGSQAISTITSLQTTLDGKAAATHTHAIADVTGLQTALDGKATSSLATTLASGLMSNTDKSKVDGIAAGATVNSTDAHLKDRSNHTGSQAISTITNLQTTLNSKADTTVATTTVNGLMSSVDKTKLNGVADNASANSADAVLLDRANHTGTQAIATITNLQSTLDTKASTSVATTSVNGLMSSVDKTKVDGIATGATANSSDATLLNRANHTGTQATSTITGLDTALAGKAGTAIVTTSTNGLASAADKTKLDGVATGATVNATDAALRDRSTHTGTQAISTVTGLQTALDAKVTDSVNIKRIHVGTTPPSDTTMLWLDTN
jgi:hypothetical protein